VIDLSVDVMRTDTVLLLLAATTTLQREQQHLLVGDKLFSDLVITASQKKDDGTKYYDSYDQKVSYLNDSDVMYSAETDFLKCIDYN